MIGLNLGVDVIVYRNIKKLLNIRKQEKSQDMDIIRLIICWRAGLSVVFGRMAGFCRQSFEGIG